jgi:hypothetical protein
MNSGFLQRSIHGYENSALFRAKRQFDWQSSNMPLCYLTRLVGN